MQRVFRSLVLVVLVAAGTVGARAAEGPGVPRVRVAHVAVGNVPVAAPLAATHLGARWRGDHDVLVEVRGVERGTSGWGVWRPLPVAHDLEDEELGLVYSGLLRVDGPELFQARASGPLRDLELVLIDAGTGTSDAAVRVNGPVGAPEIITRAGWGADEGMRKGKPKHAPVTKLVVHHTVTPNDDPDPAQTVRAIYAFHTRSRGWDDIGYHFLVDAAGRVYEGRWARPYAPGEVPTGEDGSGRGVIGAHAQAFNQGSMGFSMLGDFSGDRGPTGAAVDSLVRAVAWKASARGINPEGADPYTGANGRTSTFPNISGHRDIGQTACPGDRLYERLPEVRTRVADTIAGRSPVAPTPPAPVAPAPVPEPPAAPPPPEPPPVPVPGWWAAAPDGAVRNFGEAPASGDLRGLPLAAPIVALAATPDRDGYWLAGGDGGVFAFGNARFAGSAAGRLLAAAVHLEPTPSGRGYWVVSAAGEVVAFGDAGVHGAISTGALKTPLTAEIVGMAATPTGGGYWLAAADGRVFGFGDALADSVSEGRTVGEVTGRAKGRTVVAIAAAPSGDGYWLLGADGGVFSFGVPFHGSVPGRQLTTRAVELRVSEGGGGYYVAGDDGALFAFGDADPRRERPGRPEEAGVVDVALRPAA